jgi:hypothetical protein
MEPEGSLPSESLGSRGDEYEREYRQGCCAL